VNKIRVNDLARELEVKATILLIYLSRLGIIVKSHSHPIPDAVADKVRAHFRALDEGTSPQFHSEESQPSSEAVAEHDSLRTHGRFGKVIASGLSGARLDARAWASVLGQVRFELMSLLDKVEGKRSRGEGPNDRVKRLSFEENKLPGPIGALMRSLITFRNSSEYEGYIPNSAEAAAIKAICVALDDYAARLP
jgi:hypothetical protein